MKVQLLKDIEIEVIESFDAALDDAESVTEVFKTGETIEFDVTDHPLRMIDGELKEDPDTINVQFGDGSVAFGLSLEWFKVIG